MQDLCFFKDRSSDLKSNLHPSSFFLGLHDSLVNNMFLMTSQDRRSSSKSFNHTINASFDSILPTRNTVPSGVLKMRPQCNSCGCAFRLYQRAVLPHSPGWAPRLWARHSGAHNIPWTGTHCSSTLPCIQLLRAEFSLALTNPSNTVSFHTSSFAFLTPDLETLRHP